MFDERRNRQSAINVSTHYLGTKNTMYHVSEDIRYSMNSKFSFIAVGSGRGWKRFISISI